MKRAMVDPVKCVNCPICNVAEKCPQKAIIREEVTDKPWIDFYNCRGCMKCKVFCEYEAIIEETKPCDGKFAKSW
jgi:MinD superfamily P-loop ATPase